MRLRPLLLLVFANVVGGSAYAAAAYTLRGFSPAEAVFLRTLAGALLFLPAIFRALGRMSFTRSEWLRMAAVGVLGYALPLLMGTQGQKLSSATNASLLVCVEPLSIVLLSALFLGEPLTGLKAAALASGLLGSTLIVLQGIPFLSVRPTPHLAGDLLLFLHGFFWSLYTVIGKPVLARVDPMSFTAVTTALSLVPMAAAALPSLAAAPRPPAPPEAYWSLAYLAVAVTFLCVICWNKALKEVPASQLAPFIFLQPLVGVILGMLLQGERLTSWSGLGGTLILLGVYLAAREPSSPSVSSTIPGWPTSRPRKTSLPPTS